MQGVSAFCRGEDGEDSEGSEGSVTFDGSLVISEETSVVETAAEYVVYYESIKRKLKIKKMFEARLM